jgi:hypothetical protein
MILVVILLSLFHWVPALTWCLWNALLFWYLSLFDRCDTLYSCFHSDIVMIRCCYCYWYVLWYCCWFYIDDVYSFITIPIGCDVHWWWRVVLIRRVGAVAVWHCALRSFSVCIYVAVSHSCVVSCCDYCICVYYCRWLLTLSIVCVIVLYIFSPLMIVFCVGRCTWAITIWLHSIWHSLRCLFIAIHFVLLLCYCYLRCIVVVVFICCSTVVLLCCSFCCLCICYCCLPVMIIVAMLLFCVHWKHSVDCLHTIWHFDMIPVRIMILIHLLHCCYLLLLYCDTFCSLLLL